MRDESLAAQDRIIAIAEGAIATGLGAYARLGEQGERINRTYVPTLTEPILGRMLIQSAQ